MSLINIMSASELLEFLNGWPTIYKIDKMVTSQYSSAKLMKEWFYLCLSPNMNYLYPSVRRHIRLLPHFIHG